MQPDIHKLMGFIVWSHILDTGWTVPAERRSSLFWIASANDGCQAILSESLPYSLDSKAFAQLSHLPPICCAFTSLKSGREPPSPAVRESSSTLPKWTVEAGALLREPVTAFFGRNQVPEAHQEPAAAE